MGEFQLRLTSQAARDLREIVAYIARDNPAAAERFGLALVEKAELLKKLSVARQKGQRNRRGSRAGGRSRSDFLSTRHRCRRDRD
jgi:plasmid stabilization system protein ParE